jgi:hypothetical protein
MLQIQELLELLVLILMGQHRAIFGSGDLGVSSWN